MAGYIRQSTFVDGDTITAALFNNEYNQLVNAFSNTSGHKHDGTTAEGPVIGLIGDAGETSPNNKVLIDTTNNYIEFYVEVSSAPVQQLYIADGAIIPVTDSDIDLGTTSLRFKDTYTDTVTTTGNVSIGGDLTVTGSATISGNLTFGDADTDSINLAAEIDSHIVPNTDDTYDLGTTTKEWRNLYIDGTANIDNLVADTADINGGTIDGATIATSDITVGAGKTLNVSAGTLTLADNQISGDKVEGGTIAATTITTLTSTTGNITNVNATTVDSTNLEVTNLKAKDGTSAGSIADTTGVVTFASSVLTTTDINGGTIDGVTIGGSSAGAVTFTDLSDGTITIAGFADEDNMVSDSATLLPTQQSVKAYVDAQVTAQDLDFQGDTGGALSIDLDSESLTIAGGTGIDTSGATNTLTVAIDSTVATLTGTQTLTNKTLTSPDVNTPDIDGGTIDGTVIGGTTPAAGTFTTLTANTSITGTLATAAQPNITSLGTLTGLTTTGTLTIGTEDNNAAILEISGGPTGSAEGGEIRLDTAADYDGTYEFYRLDVSEDDFRIGRAGQTDFTIFSNGTAQFFGNLAATLSTAAQTNITSVGTLSSLTVSGDATFDTSTLKVDSTNNRVGVGTASPSTQLHLNATTGSVIRLARQDGSVVANDSLGKIEFYTNDVTNTGVAGYIDVQAEGGAAGGSMIFGTGTAGSASEQVRIAASGNVGIGTSSPQAPLHARNGSSGVSSYTAGTRAIIEGTATTYLTIAAPNTSLSGILFADPDDSDNGFIKYDHSSSGVMSFGAAGSERMRIDASGNVGIGTSTFTNSYKTYIEGLDQDTANLTDSGNHGATLYLRATANAAGSGGAVAFGTTFGNKTPFAAIKGYVTDGATNTTGDLCFSTRAGTSATALTERMRLTAAGNVGIGTSSPGRTLDVNGIIRSDGTSGGLAFGSNSSTPSEGSAIHRPASDTMAFVTNSTERMRIDASGHVVIQDDAVYTSNAPTYRGSLILAGASGATSFGGIEFHTNAGGGAGYGTKIAASDAVQTFLRRNNATGWSESMRIDSSGNLLVGTTSTTIGGSSGAGNEGVVLGGSLGNAIAVSNGGCLDLNRKTTNGTILEFRFNGSSVGSISTNANSLPSDRNYKKDIEDLNIGLDLITKLNPVSYNYKIDKDDCPKMFGLIAQDLETSLTEVGVTKNSSWLLQHEPTENEEESDYALDYLKLTPILIKAIQEQQEQIEALQSEINELKNS